METSKIKSNKKLALKKLGNGPVSMWTRSVGGRFGKDAPFPLLGAGLYWERVPFETVYQGSRGPKIATTDVIRSQSDLASQLSDFALADVDFGKEELIFVGLGARPSNGYMVQIEEIIYLTDRGPKFTGPLTYVNYSEYRTSGRLDVETYPLHVIKLRKLEGTETQFFRCGLSK